MAAIFGGPQHLVVIVRRVLEGSSSMVTEIAALCVAVSDTEGIG